MQHCTDRLLLWTQVCVIEPAPLAEWPNNYGVWVDEFQAMGLQDCLEVTWPKARVFLDSGPDGIKCAIRTAV